MTRTRIRVRSPRRLAAAALLLVAAGLGACGGDSDEDAGGSAVMEKAADGGGGDEMLRESAGAAGGGQGLDLAGSAAPSVSDSVIKDARLEVRVPSGNFEEAVQRAESIAAQYGGFVFSTSVADTDAKRGTVVIRVPSSDFERALSDLKDEGTLKSQDVTGRDVSEEFIDLQARIGNLEAQEAVILRLMKRATTVSQTIRIQSELSGIQLEIERLKGRLRFLEDRTSFGTISVTFVEAGAPAPEAAGMLDKAWDQAVDVMLGVIAALIVSLGFVVPLGVLGGIVYLIVRQVRKPRLAG